MPHLFTIRWPLFARLEAVLLFPVVVLLSSEIASVRTLADRGLLPALISSTAPFGISPHALTWAATTIVVVVPYLLALSLADRFLTIRKGFLLLSLIAISVWAFAGTRFTSLWATFLLDSFPAPLDRLPTNQQAMIAAGCVAFLLHLKPLWRGLRDDGDVAAGLISAQEENAAGRGSMGNARRAMDVYYRQTADFRGWRPMQPGEGLQADLEENGVVRFLYGIAWIGVIAGAAALFWTDFSAASRIATRLGPPPEVIAGRGEPGRISAATPPLHPLGTPAASIAPAAHAPATLPLPTVHTVAPMPVPAPLPTVQRPGQQSVSLDPANGVSGPNEAVAERGRDGSFAFDAVVNGTHMPMLFDTGASVVAIRAEDAERLGIALSNLRYSAKVKTANGTADVAPIIIDTLTIGNITQRSVAGFVAKQGMLQMNLLGQTFLARLSGYNVEKNHLVLMGH